MCIDKNEIVYEVSDGDPWRENRDPWRSLEILPLLTFISFCWIYFGVGPDFSNILGQMASRALFQVKNLCVVFIELLSKSVKNHHCK